MILFNIDFSIHEIIYAISSTFCHQKASFSSAPLNLLIFGFVFKHISTISFIFP